MTGQTIPAALLGGQHVGRVIRARVGDSTVVQDEVTRIAHHGGVTDVSFANVQPAANHDRLDYGTTFRLDHDDEVEVIER